MNLREITRAVDDRDNPAIRDAFRGLVDFPHEGGIEIDTAGLLMVALQRVSGALSHDAGTMPKGTCEALNLPQGASYAQGAQAALVQSARLARGFTASLDRAASRVRS